MKKLFYVEDDQITRKAFEHRLKASSWELYTLESMEEFSFRFKDFGADMLFCSPSFIQDEQVLEAIETSQIPVGCVGFREETGSLKVSLFEKPIDIMNLESLLDCFYKEQKSDS